MPRRMTRRPLIGLVAGTSDAPELTVCRNSLIEALARAEASVAILPHGSAADVPACLDACDGLLLPGGGDFSPAYFGGPPNDPRLRRVDARRDAFEFALVREADARRMPVLGICKGMQWMAVARGGTILIDLNDELPGAFDHSRWDVALHEPVHDVILAPGSRLRDLAGADRLPVNSRHHQSVGELGRSVAAARAADGVVEAIEWPDAPFAIGVQWHPEDRSAVGDGFSLRLFAAFRDAALARGR